MAALFQKRHYEFLARFAALYLEPQQIQALADQLAMDNDHFNEDRFLEAARARINCNWCGKPHHQPAQSALQALATCCKA